MRKRMFVADTLERIAHRLSGSAPDPSTLALTAGGREIIRFCRGPHAVTASLCMPNGKQVDVSRSPVTVCSALDDAARGLRADPAAWRRGLLQRLGRAAVAWDAPWPATAHPALEEHVLALTHPALVAAVDAGLRADDDVPAWASKALRHRDLTAITEAFVGPTTRAVSAALARLLTSPHGGRLAWWPLAVGVAAATHVEPDDVAALFGTSLEPPPARTPAVEHVSALRSLFGCYERDVVVRIARAGLRDVDALRDLVGLARRSGEIARLPVTERPTRLPDLVQMTRASARPTRTGRLPEPPPPASWQQARTAPTARSTRRAAARFDELRAVLDGCHVGDLVIEAPRSTEELHTWAAVLENCLASFEGAVRRRRSLVLAVRRDGLLVAAIEIDPATNTLRQFHGPRNRPPSAAVEAPVLAMLRSHGVEVR